jgi:hypothetical protein
MWVRNMWLLAVRNTSTAEMSLLVIIKDVLDLDRKAGGGKKLQIRASKQIKDGHQNWAEHFVRRHQFTYR